MKTPIEEDYLIWLYSQVHKVSLKSKSRTYWALFNQMQRTEFVWFVPNDDNRIEDGRDLRYEFIFDADILDPDVDWVHQSCSFLEMLLALAKRMSFQTDDPVDVWFWHLMENLGLHEYTDSEEPFSDTVHAVMETVVWRTYSPDGTGGLFPLKHPDADQTKVEIWYQLCAYLSEIN